MNRLPSIIAAAVCLLGLCPSTCTGQAPAVEDAPALLSDIRQLTFEGRRAGEGYFSADGKAMVFQSEREPGNPFFQIYWMDRENGDTHRISPGIGKTTCAWIHPDGQRVLYASTQYDPEAVAKQEAELEFRASGQTRRYSWDYDETYELVEFDMAQGQYRRLTNAPGYDAEGSYSPDGRLICFASNRRAYSGELSDEERELFEFDQASAMDLYLMNSDGSNLRRLTQAVGYDGGPFFSPDGSQICWRRFDRSGETAEIMLMNVDGSNQRRLTDMGAVSWAPFFHPSGDYLIFTTNLHGFGNFELYMIDAAGQHTPVRVTDREGFDALPVFTPDGQGLVWTSNGGGSQSQLYEAHWDDAAARKALGLGADVGAAAAGAADVAAGARAARDSAPGFTPEDIGRHVDFLCRPELGGRLTGTPGERRATAYVAAYLESLGLEPAGSDGSFFHEFEFVSDVVLGPDNRLQYGDDSYQLDSQWRPVFFSREGPVEPTDVVFAGYGIVAKPDEGQPEYDSYVHLDVQDKWVLVFRQMPQDIAPERRQHLAQFSSDRFKAMVARDHGARGLIFVSGPTSPLRRRIMPLQMDGTLSGSSLSVISVDDSLAQQWLRAAGKDLRQVQRQLDDGQPQMGFALEGVQLSANIDIQPVTSRGRNVLGLLPAGAEPTAEMILVGAHIDHLGSGKVGGSRAKEEELGGVHRGADDNASGVASMMEIAQYLAGQVSAGQLKMRRDVLFAAWSGEELGLRGSQAFADDFYFKLFTHRMAAAHGTHGGAHGTERNPHGAGHASQGPLESDGDAPQVVANAESSAAAADHGEEPHGGSGGPTPLYPMVAACLNLDMVGRLRDQLVLQGIGSSDYWKGAIERRNAVVRLPITLQDDCDLPTDASTFFIHRVPILSAFTGSHSEYHTPRDVPELLNYQGTAEVARLLGLIARDLSLAEQPPNYHEQTAQPQMRANMTASLGTVPNYTQGDIQGVLLSDATKGAPAHQAGVRGGDIVVELAGRKIENIYDYTYAIEALKVGQKTTIKVRRGEETLELEITPASRE